MNRLSQAELGRLSTVAREIHDKTDDDGYLVDRAVSLDSAFRRGTRGSGTLSRSQVLDAAVRGATDAGMGFEDTRGGGLDLLSIDQGIARRYRLKKAEANAGGTYDMICGLGSTLLYDEPDALIREEKWILGYTPSADHTVDQVFVAPIVGHRGQGPVHLVLGEITIIDPSTPPKGFTSSNEDLPGFEDETDTGLDTGS